METKQQNNYEEVSKQIVALLKTQQNTWQQPWVALDNYGGLARNASTGRMYSLLNQLLVSKAWQEHHYPKNTWITYKQAKALGGSIIKGEKSTSIYFNKYQWKDSDGLSLEWKDIKHLSVDERKEQGIYSYYFLTVYHVFNVAQTKDLPQIYYELPREHHRISFDIDGLVLQILSNLEYLKIVHYQEGDKAYFDPECDIIVLPFKEQFISEEGFYETLFHEFIHWTGHKDRLNRKGIYEESKEAYAHEELIAELGGAFLCAQLGLRRNISNNADYIQSWLKAIEADEKYLVKIIYHAEKACKYILEEFDFEEGALSFLIPYKAESNV